MMTFDGDSLGVRPLRPGNDFHLLIADLCGKKDTVRILADLNDAFPFANTPRDLAVQRCLGEENQRIVAAARAAIEAGDAAALGALMTEAQAVFDLHLMPVCEELKSPRLHAVLQDPQVCAWSYGGKGVGSQGDGCVQFICKSVRDRTELEAYLTRQYGLPCFELDIRRPVSIRKAVIPVAGLGTRMFPYTKAVPKTFLPVVTPDGVAKPVIQVIIEEALSAGVEEIALVIQPEDEARFRAYFEADVRAETLAKLPPALGEEAERVLQIGKRLTYLPQHEAKGFGHAVLLAERWVGHEPFLLLLGDQIFRSAETRSVARQVVDLFQTFGDSQSVVGIYEESLDRVKHYGAVSGEWVSDDTLQLSRVIEKPTEDEAQTYLAVTCHGKESFFCVNGLYALRPRLFGILRQQAAAVDGAELQLTPALEALRQEDGVKGLVVRGRHFDTGIPAIYAETVGKFTSKIG